MGKCGRPTTYTREIADRICELIAGGENMHAACEIAGIPHKTFRNWKDANHDGFGDRVNNAYTADYANAVADRYRNKVIAQQQIRKHAYEAALAASMHENPTRSMSEHRAFAQSEADAALYVNGIDPRLLEIEQKWLAFDLPRRHKAMFGDRVAITHDGNLAIKEVPDDRLQSRIADLLGKAGIRAAPSGTDPEE